MYCTQRTYLMFDAAQLAILGTGGREFILVDSGLSPTDGAELLAAMVAPLKGRYADLQALAASVEGVPHRLSQLGVQLCNEKEPGARLSELLAHSEETDALKEEVGDACMHLL